MTELSFSKQFLSTLASYPARIPPDFCEDPRKLPSRTPYTLPPQKKSKIKHSKAALDSAIPTANITIKSLRGATISHSLPDTPLSSTILTLKLALSTATKIPIDKLKLLLKGKVLTDLKTLKDLGIEEGVDVNITVMIMGGATPVTSSGPATPAEEKTGLGIVPDKDVEMREGDVLAEKVVLKKNVLKEEKFWEELREFLDQRLGSGAEEDPGVVLTAFKDAWGKRSS